MAATATAPPPAPPKKNKAEIQFTGELDEILKRITEIKNIAGLIVVNSEGITVKSTVENSLSVQVHVICDFWPYYHKIQIQSFSTLNLKNLKRLELSFPA